MGGEKQVVNYSNINKYRNGQVEVEAACHSHSRSEKCIRSLQIALFEWKSQLPCALKSSQQHSSKKQEDGISYQIIWATRLMTLDVSAF